MNIEEAKDILGLKGAITPEDIRRAFRDMALRTHPDRYRTFSEQAFATRRFIKVKEAYDFLNSLGGIDSKQGGEYYGDSPKEEGFDNGITGEGLQGSKYSKYDLFNWLFISVPNKFKLGFVIGWITLPLLFAFIPYWIVLDNFQDILLKRGIEAYPNSRSKKGRFSFLAISTLTAFLYLPVFYWIFFTRTGQQSPTMTLIIIGTVCSLGVVLFVISEWISFFLTSIWQHTIESDLGELRGLITRRT